VAERPLRVLVLSQYYAPEPIFKPVELARALSHRGHRVSVLTGLPHYPTGRLYPGYALTPWRREIIDDIPVLRTFEVPYHGTRAGRRMLNYGSFMLSAIVGGLFVPKPDVIYVWHPPLSMGIAAWAVARLRRAPFVYDVQDIWPESAVLSGVLREGRLVRLLSRLERFVYRRADHLLVVTEGARQNLVAKGVPADKITVLYPWADEDQFGQPAPDAACRVRREQGWGADFVILFAGNVGLVQGLDSAVTAMQQLPASSRARLVIIGDGSDLERVRGLVADRGLTARVQFIDRQPLSSMPAFLAAADVLLVHVRASELSKLILPSKTLTYLAAAKPVLVGAAGAAANLIAEARAGRAVPPDDPQALAEAIRDLESLSEEQRQEMGASGRAYLLDHLSKAALITAHERLLTAAAAGRS
jgi:glycosyltransferase involved in cell wall biosynthesis